VRRNSLRVRVPIVGQVTVPVEDLAFLGGVATLAVVGVLEWPIALLLGVGHSLATAKHSKTVNAFGQALEAA
jgi:hypothetical protein